MSVSLKLENSSTCFSRASRVLVGGVNSPVRAFKGVGMSPPLFIRRGKGSQLEDVDGNRYVDYVGSWGAMIVGHAHERILEAINRIARDGTSFGAPTELETAMAERLREWYPSLELVRFVNSGGEAVQGALRLARGFTSRDKVIKFAGCYHGSLDALLVKAGSGATTLGVPDSAGVPIAAASDTLLAEFNSLESIRHLLQAHPEQVAAVLLEPIAGNMGLVPPEPGFLEGLRDLCNQHGCLLLFDEVMSGFRVAKGGAQECFGVQPDLAMFGKVIGGGLPVGAYGGRADIMSLVAPQGPVYQAGTLSGNPLAMAAGLATMEILEAPDTYSNLANTSKIFINGLRQSCQKADIPVQVAAFGGMLGFFFHTQPVKNYQDALNCNSKLYARFFQGMLEHGVYLPPSAYETLFVSTVHTQADLELTLDAMTKTLANMNPSN